MEELNINKSPYGLVFTHLWAVATWSGRRAIKTWLIKTMATCGTVHRKTLWESEVCIKAARGDKHHFYSLPGLEGNWN